MAEVTAVDVTGGSVTAVKPQLETKLAPEITLPVPEVPLTPEEQKTKDDSASRFAQLSRREKQIRAKAKEIETREAAIKAREVELQALSQPKPVDWKERLKSDPMGALSEAGMTYDDMVNQLLTQNPQDQSLRLIQNELKAIRDENSQLRKSMEEKEQSSYQQALNQLKFDVKNMVTSDNETYEALAASGETGYDMVVKLIKETFDKDKTIMDMEDAAKEVEEYLADRYLELAKLKKIQAKLTPTQAAAQAETPAPQTPSQPKTNQTTIIPKTNTLSHSMTPSSKAPLSNRDRRERAILAFEGKLNS